MKGPASHIDQLIRGLVGLRHAFSVGGIVAALVLTASDHLVYVAPEDAPRNSYTFDFFMSSSEAGLGQVYFDVGRGFNAAHCSQLPVVASDAPQPYRFPIPAGRVRRLRLDFLMGPGRVAIYNARLVNKVGQEIRKIRPAEFVPNDQISSSEPNSDGVNAIAPEGVNDPYFIITFPEPVQLPTVQGGSIARNPWLRAGIILTGLAVIAIGGHLVRRARPKLLPQVCATLAGWRDAHPRACLVGVATLATIASCYPVIFLGRSFVSPNTGPTLLYNTVPTLPGMTSTELESVQGADVGALMWAHLPYSHIEARALLQRAELPLWNRYSSGGIPLLGQGQSMLGDPLHLLVIAAHGAAWAWDIKFLAARLLFCTGVGWLAWSATRHFGTAAAIAFAAAFLGFFNFRINHPAIFALTYSPWILVAWSGLAGSAQARNALAAVTGLIVANFAVFASGTVKEASMLVGSLNAVGLVMLLAAPLARGLKIRLVGVAIAGGIAGILMGAPLWLTFVESLRHAVTYSDGINVTTLPWRALATIFDGIFLQESYDYRPVVSPSANFLILLGMIFFVLRANETMRDRLAWPSFAGAVAASCMVLGIVPAAWIAAVPGLRHVAHIYNTFSCVAIVLMFLPAARGLATAWERPPGRRARAENAVVILLGMCIVALFFSQEPARWLGDGSRKTAIAQIQAHHYFFRSIALMLAAWVVLFEVRNLRRRATHWTGATLILSIAALLPLLGRHGHRLQRGHDEFFFRPMERPDFAVQSPAITWMTEHSKEPFRAVGVNYTLLPGFTAVLDVEGINGPDAVMSGPYREFALATGLADPGDWYYSSKPDALAAQQRTLDCLNTAYYVTAPGLPPISDTLEKIADLDLAVFRSASVWPRAFFTNRVFPCASAAEFTQRLRGGDGEPFATLFPDDFATLHPSPTGASGVFHAAQDYQLATNSTSFDVEATAPGLVVLTETWWPNSFRAWINGNPARVLRVNHAFKGVAVTAAGVHHIEFRYEPQYFRLSLALALAGLIGFAFIVRSLNRSHRFQSRTRNA